jgi:protein transport protein SEC61 subunit gamma and related proteins
MAVIENVRSFLMKCSRVWQILKKPNMEEYKAISKVSAIGILVIGVIGFAISAIMNIF